jgi:hypothetical protein
VSLEIKDAAGTKIYSNYDYVKNTSATFAYKIAKDVVGGEYTIKVSNQY